jgi:ATP-binding cassette, subfamily B, multidrug efflux pump
MSGRGYLRRLTPYIWESRGYFLIGLVSMLVVSVLRLVDPLIIGHVIDVSVPHKDLSDLTRWALFYVAVVLSSGFLSYFQVIFLGRLGLRIITKIKGEVFDHLLQMPVAYFDKNPVGELIARVENDSERIRGLFSDLAVTIVGNALFFIGMLGVMLYRNWTVTAILMIPFTGIMILVVIVVRKLSWFYRRVRELYADVSSVLTEYIQGMEVVQAFNRQALAEHILDVKSIEKRQVETRSQFYEYSLWGVLSFMIETVFIILVILLSVPKILNHAMTLGALVVFVQYSGRLFWPLLQVAENINQFQRAFVSLRRIFDMLELPTETDERGRVGSREFTFEREIEFRDLSFAYKPGEWVLRNVSLTIPRGSKTALVGPSGGGKTTVVSLLCGFYPVTEGELLVDGVSLRDIELHAWRRKIGLVLQDIYLFPGDIRENIRVYDESVSEKRVRDSLRVVSAEDLVETRDSGLDTEIKEQGRNFSQGEKQLLSFARAVVVEPEIVILDEATASVDVRTEARIQKALESVLEGKTSVIVAHRLSTIVNADQILYIENGTILARGRHEELLADCAAYRRLVELQFAAGVESGRDA